MSAKRPGLFGHRPDMLLVDERPRGIDLSALAAAPLPKLVEEPPPAPPPLQDEDDTVDDDSYDGDGPLRIFIGSPKVAAAAAPVAPPIDLGPVWDASSLALGGEDEVEDPSDALPTHRRPVLVKKGLPIEPPPLTMSFGGSFTRGSLDAGVMDESTADSTGDPASRGDSVIVHDDIFDRFLHFDDPTASPPPRALPPQVIPPLESMDDEEMLAAAEADPELGEDILQAGFDMPEKLEPGKPPTRLRVGIRGNAAPSPQDEDDDEDADADEPDESSADRLDLELGIHLEDESGPVVPQVRVGGPGMARDIPPVHDRTAAAPAFPAPPTMSPPASSAAPAPSSDRLVLPPSEAPAVRPSSDEDKGWASRRRNGVAAAARAPAPAPEEESGSGLGLLVFVLVAVGGLALAWYFLGRSPDGDASDLPAVVPRHESAPQQTPPGGDGTAPEPAPAPATGGTEAAASPGEASGAPPSEAPADGAAPTEEPPVATTASSADPLLVQAAPSQDVGSLRVRATRPSRVYVDGKLVGETPMAALTLPPGEHEIRVVAIDSGRTRSQIVRVDADRAQEVRFSF